MHFHKGKLYTDSEVWQMMTNFPLVAKGEIVDLMK